MSVTDPFMEVLTRRRSIRRYQKRAVPSDMLLQLVEAASWSPSASNRQDWFFTIITRPELLQSLAAKTREGWRNIIQANQDLPMIEEVEAYAAGFGDIGQAPALIAVSAARPNRVQEHLLGDLAGLVSGNATSAAMAAQNLMLAAEAHGLGTCCMTGALAADREMAQLLELTPRQQLVCLINVGYPDEAPSPPARKPADRITRMIE